MANKTQTTQKELKLDGVILCQRKMKALKELEERTIPAEKYLAKCKAKRIAKKKRKAKIKEVLVLTTLWVTLGLLLVFKCSYEIIRNANDPHYENTVETEINREYPVEAICEIVEVDETENIVTVEYNGEEYSFNGDRFFVGEKILCKFTQNMELVDVER